MNKSDRNKIRAQVQKAARDQHLPQAIKDEAKWHAQKMVRDAMIEETPAHEAKETPQVEQAEQLAGSSSASNFPVTRVGTGGRKA